MKRSRLSVSARGLAPCVFLIILVFMVVFLSSNDPENVVPTTPHYTTDFFGVVLDYRDVIAGAQETTVPISSLLGVTGSIVGTTVHSNIPTRFDVTSLVPRPLVVRLRDGGELALLTVTVPVAWNFALLSAACSAYADIMGTSTSVSQLLSQFSKHDTISDQTIAIGALGIVRGQVGGSGWNQRAVAVRNKGDHVAVSAVLLGQAMCGSGPSTTYTPLGEVPQYVDADVHPTIAARIATTVEIGSRINNLYLKRMQREMKLLTSSTPRRHAEEMLLSKIQIWNPLQFRPVPERLALAVLFRPTIACVTLTAMGDGLRLALLQRRLWGYQCDRHLIFLGNDEPAQMPDYDEVLQAAGIPPQDVIHLKIPEFIAVKGKNNVWQRLRESIVWLEQWSQLRDYHYYYFVQPDVYAIPENMYAMIMEQGWYYLNAASTPLFLGRRMLFPEAEGNGTRFIPYINTRAGFMLNFVALKLLSAMIPLGECHDHAVTDSIDLLLASCFSHIDITPRDTADDLGEERFHVIALHWMLLSTKESSGWYIEHQARSTAEVQQNPLRLVSTSSIAFGQVDSAERALWFHKVLRE